MSSKLKKATKQLQKTKNKRESIGKTDKSKKTSTTTSVKEMPKDYGLYTIDNNVIYGGKGKPHIYAVYFNKDGTVNKAVETTHVIEKEKVEKIKKGVLTIEQFGGMHLPSGVNNSYYKKDITNRALTKKTEGINATSYTITTKQAKRIYDFAKKERK